jgi:hypothetical protein
MRRERIAGARHDAIGNWYDTMLERLQTRPLEFREWAPRRSRPDGGAAAFGRPSS